MSLLSWERGLKFIICINSFIIDCRSSRGSVDWNSFFMPQFRHKEVAPLVGAWIEIKISDAIGLSVFCRSSRGSVDWNFAPVTSLLDKLSSLLSWERGLK